LAFLVFCLVSFILSKVILCEWKDAKMRVVIRIGGSVVASPINTELIGEYADLLRRLQNAGHKIVLVVGGGTLAREFIQYAKDLGLKEAEQDEAAISVSRLVAQLFMLKLGNTGIGMVPVSLDDVRKKVETGEIVVMGGLKPGMTTDTVAAMAAEKIKADLMVKATDQEGVYTRDPRKHKDAKKIDKLSFDDLTRLFEQSKHKAGIHQIIDPEAVKILRASRTKTIVVSGFKPENVSLAIEGRKIGTVIE
jgi:uridylate kinase